MWMWWLGAAWAGGGPQNVMVLYNADVAEAEAVAAHYADARDLPAGHLCGLGGIGETETSLAVSDYLEWVLAPLSDCLAALPQPEDIDYLVLVRGLPYKVIVSGGDVSLDAALQIYKIGSVLGGSGLLVEDGNPEGLPYITNPHYDAGSTDDYTVVRGETDVYYATAPAIVSKRYQNEAFERSSEPRGYDDNLFIVTRLDGFDYQDAMDVVDRGVAADGTFPEADFLCMYGADAARGVRDGECEYVTRVLSGMGFSTVWVDAFDGSLAGHEVVAYFTGAANVQGGIAGQTYVPGAITDNITSFGAVPDNFFCDASGKTCPASESQTSVARFIRAGATGAHGTVSEPYNAFFPNAGALLHYALGYSLGESYFFNQWFLNWRNLVIGDPLATPFAERPVVSVAEASVAVNLPLTVSASHPDGIHRVYLYADDVLVASSEEDADTLAWIPADSGHAPGETLQLRAVAEAGDVDMAMDGWDVDETRIRARTQGWTLTTVALTDAVELPGDTGQGDSGADNDDGAADTKDGGRGCATTGGLAGGLWLAALVALRRRR